MNSDEDLIHEVLDRVHVLSDTFQRHVREHSYVQKMPDVLRDVDIIVEEMEDLYQKLGALMGEAAES